MIRRKKAFMEEIKNDSLKTADSYALARAIAESIATAKYYSYNEALQLINYCADTIIERFTNSEKFPAIFF